jgi:hypothetical protein
MVKMTQASASTSVRKRIKFNENLYDDLQLGMRIPVAFLNIVPLGPEFGGENA